jgi:hypothetical protein
VPEPARVVHLHQEAPLDRFVDAVGAAERGQQLQVELEPGRGGDLEGVAPRRRQPLGAEEHGLLDGVGQGEGLLGPELHGACRRRQPSRGRQRHGELLDEERHPLGPVVQRPRKPVPRPRPQHPGGERGGVRRAERVDGQLLEAPAAAQLRAHAAELVPARHLVAAVGAKDQHRCRLERPVQLQQQLGGGGVDPLEVVKEHHGGPLARELLEEVGDRLEQGRLVGVGGRRAELGEDQREMPRQRPGTGQAVGDRALVAAERRDHRRVGSDRPLVGGAAQHEPAVPGEGGLHQRGLAHAAFPGDQEDPAVAACGGRDGAVERGALPLPADELHRPWHGSQCTATTRPRLPCPGRGACRGCQGVSTSMVTGTWLVMTS